MQITPLHAWNVPPEEAIDLQNQLASRLIDAPIDIAAIKLVAGVDVSVQNEISQAAVVVLSYPDLQPIETVRAHQPTSYPYIPGLLTFREGEVLVKAFEQLQSVPDVFIFDGMGRIHPRKMGIAAHMGLWLDRPTIGCGKTHFLGTYVEPGNERGDFSPLMYKKEQLGVILRTRPKVKPVYISAGHRMILADAVALTMACTPKYRLPQPIRAAHLAAGKMDDI
jgi:deoxyribonuclease V